MGDIIVIIWGKDVVLIVGIVMGYAMMIIRWVCKDGVRDVMVMK